MTLAAVLLIAAIADTVTMLALPPGAERNPFAAAMPMLAVGLKLTVALCTAWLVVQHRRYFRGVALVGTVLWTFGAATNLAVLA